MLLSLIAIFIGVPILEVWIIVQVGQQISWLPTLAILIGVGLLGSTLARYQGLKTWNRIRDDLAHARLPSDHLLDGLMILVASVLMITPGFLTDLVGILLLLPPIRTVVRNRVKARLYHRIQITQHFHWSPPPDVIDTEARSEDF